MLASTVPLVKFYVKNICSFTKKIKNVKQMLAKVWNKLFGNIERFLIMSLYILKEKSGLVGLD
jgi:hypothetical protein